MVGAAPRQSRAMVVEDERPLGAMVAAYLERAGLEVVIEHSGPAAVDRARGKQVDVVLLDLGLPGMDGIEVCRTLRTFSDCYILMLTARGDEVDRLVGLAAGADDYIVKPFSVREVVARVQAVLRRPRSTQHHDATMGSRPSIAIGDLVIDGVAHEVRLGGVEIALTRTEFDVLKVIAGAAGAVLPRRRIIDAVWVPGWIGDEHVVDVHVANIRRKLGDSADSPRYIVTVRGVGFRAGKE